MESCFLRNSEWETTAEEYLLSLDRDQRAKIAAVIETIEEIGFVDALNKTKYISSLGDKIFEVRVEWKSNNI